MSMTATIDYDQSIHDKCTIGWKMVTGILALDNSYPSGGYDLDLSKQLPEVIKDIIFVSRSGYVFEYDKANKKVKAMYGDYSSGSDGALVEVANGVNLSSLTDVFFVAFGK